MVGLHDMLGQVAKAHRGVIDPVKSLVRLSQVALGDLGHDAVDVKRALGAGLRERGRSVAAVVDSEPLEDARGRVVLQPPHQRVSHARHT